MLKYPQPCDGVEVSYKYVRIPAETPVGVRTGTALEVSFLGRRFHYIEDDGEAAVLFALDTGEVERWYW